MTIQHGRLNNMAEDGKVKLFGVKPMTPNKIVPFHFVLIWSILIWNGNYSFNGFVQFVYGRYYFEISIINNLLRLIWSINLESGLQKVSIAIQKGNSACIVGEFYLL